MPLAELRKPSKALLKLWADQQPEDRHEEFIPTADSLATWWTQITPGTTYWRAYVPAKHLPGQALRLKYSDLKQDAEGNVFVPRQRGTAIWQFVGVAVRALIMAHQQDQGVRVLMELDDNYLVPVPIPLLPGSTRHWQTSLSHENAAEYSHQAHRKIVRWIDGLIVSTEEIAARYAQATQVPIYHCPNSIDLDDWVGHAQGWGRARTGDSGALAIGYAGSDSHRYDLALIERGMDWAWRQPNVKLWKIGAATKTWRVPYEQVPWSDNLPEYRRNLQVLDVGLCPLKRSDWHDGKSDIKAMEYLLSGAVPIVQRDSPCYRDWIDVVPSATTPKDWLKQIKWAVGAPREELREVWQRGYDFLLERKLIGQHIHKWQEAVK